MYQFRQPPDTPRCLSRLYSLCWHVLQLLMLTTWKEITTSSQRRDVLSYWRLAGIHGMSWPYNGINAPSE